MSNIRTSIFRIVVVSLASLFTVIQAEAEEATVVITLTRQPIWEGPIPYVGTFPGIGSINGSLQKIENRNGFSLLFPKFGRSTAECGNLNAVVVLGSRQSMTRENLQAIYNTPTPALPVTFVACATAGLPVPDLVLLSVTYNYVGPTPRPMPPSDPEVRSCSEIGPNTITCRIYKPFVKQPTTFYREVRFQPGDRVTIDAGGCVQTGGLGRTWKRYVDPQGPNSDRLYHGLFWLPGAAEPVRIGSMIGGSFTIPSDITDPNQLFLSLGYEDDNYDDNGYWGHDDGTGNQCRNVGPAWLLLTINRNMPTELIGMEHGIDRPGEDYRGFDLSEARPELCQNECARDPRCKAYTFVRPGGQGPKARCWLKSSIPNPQINLGCISGLRSKLPSTLFQRPGIIQ